MSYDPDHARSLALFNKHLWLADYMTKVYVRQRRYTWELTRAFALEGLFDAARRFDPAFGVSFNSYAKPRIGGAIVDGWRAECVVSRRVHERMALGITLEQAVKLLGHRGEKGTANREMVAQLGKRARLKRFVRADPCLSGMNTAALFRVKWEDGKHHLALMECSGEVFDPQYEKPAPYFRAWAKHVRMCGGRIVSYLPLSGKFTGEL